MKTFLKSTLIIATSAVISIAADNFGGLGISVYAGKNGVNVVGVMPKSPASRIE